MKSNLFSLCLFLLMFTACGSNGHQAEQLPSRSIDTIPMMVMQIQKCSRLYTSEYQLHKIVTFNDSMSFKGSFLQQNFKINLPMGRRKVAIPMTAHVKAYIDFSQLSDKNVLKQGDRIEIILPDPQVTMTSTQIDHEAIKKKVSFLRHDFTDEEMTHIQKQGRQDMIRSLAKLGILENARQNAARQLIPIMENLGYRQDQITITFRKKFTFDDLTALVRNID